MALVIDASAGSASANSYVTLAEANSYTEARLNSTTWDSASDDSKNRALVEATRELDVLSWDGTRVTATQALSWPREWIVNPDDPDGDYYDETIVPQRVKDACCELAFQFIKAGTTDIAGRDATDGIVRKKVDVLETQYANPSERITEGLARWPRVWDRVAPLLTDVGTTIDIVRG